MAFLWFSPRSLPLVPLDHDWQQACRRVPLLGGLAEDENLRLFERAKDFLARKRLTFHPDLATTPFDTPARLALAGQACLLTLGWPDFEHRDAFSNVHEIIVLPDAFQRHVEHIDEAGVLHAFTDIRIGETSYQGPVVVSFRDLMENGGFSGHNVLIHELAHKLDMGNAVDVDGFPPLPVSITPAEWHGIFSQVWNDLQRRLENGQDTVLDAYAASHPGECFAVCCEAFFSAPRQLADHYPALYALLCRYFNQQPLPRQPLG